MFMEVFDVDKNLQKVELRKEFERTSKTYF